MIPTLSAALLPALAVLPVAGALVCLVTPVRRRAAAGFGAILVAAAVAVSVVVLVAVDGPVAAALGGHAPPLGIELRADGPSAALLLALAVVGVLVSIHAFTHPAHAGDSGPRLWFWPLWLLAWAGLATIAVAGDLFTLYVAVEVLGLSAVGLVALGGPGTWRAAFDYLVVAVAGSLLYLLAVALTYSATGTLDLTLAHDRLHDGAPASSLVPAAIAGLAITGMAFKSALFPLHGWLPPAHGGAPVAVSPLLSGLVVKGSFFVAFRVWSELTGPVPGVAIAAGVLAVSSMVWGGLVALRCTGLKQLVAYSTISQIGYLFLYFPLSAAAGDDADVARQVWAATATFLIAHAVAKAGLFLAAGIVKERNGTDAFADITAGGRGGGLLTMSIGLVVASLVGIPLSLGFAAKWQLIVASVSTGSPVLVAGIVVGSVIAAFYLIRPVQAFIADRTGTVVPIRLALVPFALGVVATASIVAAPWLSDLVVAGYSGGGLR